MTKKIIEHIVQISLGIILVLSVTQILHFEKGVVSKIGGESNWTETTDTDFNDGTSDNVVVLTNGSVKLALQKKYIEDNFINESKISSKQNITIDINLGEVKLLKIIKTFGGANIDAGHIVQQTLDGGYIIAGIYTYGPGEQKGWLIKTDHYGNEEWNKTFGSFINSVQQTLDGNYLIVGATESYGAGKSDILLIKVDSLGNEQWNKTFGGSESDYGYSIQQTSDGGYIIVGSTWSYGAGDEDVWLIKTNSLGTKQWDKTFGGGSGDEGYSVQQTSDNGYILAGYTASYGAGNGDFWLIKTDASGNEQWNKTFGNSHVNIARAGQQTSDGGYMIIGRTQYNVLGEMDVWLIKTDSLGIMQWNKTFGGPLHDSGWWGQQTSDNGYIIIGITESYGVGLEDIWLIKTDVSGNEQWNKTFGGSSWDYGYSVQQTSDDGYIITGETNSYGPGWFDVWLIKTDMLGNIDFKNGDLISANLFSGTNATLIKTFNYTSSIPPGTSIKVQFSQDNSSWYNSNNVLNDWDILSDGSNSIELTDLGWQGLNLYYKMSFSTEGENIPVLQNINLSFIQYFSIGSLESQPFNTQEEVIWKTLQWNAIKPIGTEIKFQLRSGNSKDDLLFKNYVGPDGQSSNYYNMPGQIIWDGHNFDKWIQYKAYFSTNDDLATPILQEVTISFNNIPKLVNLLISPSFGDITQNFNFTIEYLDNDNDPPLFIKVCIDGINYTMNESDSEDNKFLDGKIYWFSTKFKAGNHTHQFFTSDGDIENFTDKKIIKVDFGPLDHIIVKPPLVKITTDDYQKFNAIGYDVDNNLLSISPTWEVNGGGNIDQTGNFSAIKPGTWKVFANASGISGNSTITITEGKLNEIIITPSFPEINTDKYILFNATGYDTDMNVLQITPQWNVTGGGKIKPNGNFTATTPGKWIIFANISEISGNTTITITLGKLNQIIIIPNFIEINISESIEFNAKGFDADHNEIDISPIWSVSGGGTIEQNGKFTANTQGTWIIYANQSDISGNATVKIFPKEKKDDNDNKTEGDRYNIILSVSISIIIIIIVLILLFQFVFKKSLNKNQIKNEVKPIEKKETQQQIQTQSQTTQQIKNQNEDTSPFNKINQEQ